GRGCRAGRRGRGGGGGGGGGGWGWISVGGGGGGGSGGRCGGVRGGRLEPEAAAECVVEVDRGQVAQRAHLGQLLLGLQQRALRRQHLQLVADAGRIAGPGQLQGGPGRGAGLLQRALLRIQRADRLHRVGDLVQGVDHALVVGGHGQVVVGGAGVQAVAAGPRVEDRQA